ncbi:hypothetical protein J8J42_12145 [Chryseobacterium sp. cx-311]|uniref:hypothetical protein n=1 Tax=Marnyiella aurantia TaxID=2758037 RepID=UPI001AE5664F|nr:hypothetical protein [Marnyiella aurantia]MBP0613790.1 hypothetical protein [Marnyiella aurantia]
MKKLTTMVAAILFAATINAQQWDGPSNSTDNIHRNGNVTVGLSTFNEKFNVGGNLKIAHYNHGFNMHFATSPRIAFGSKLATKQSPTNDFFTLQYLDDEGNNGSTQKNSGLYAFPSHNVIIADYSIPQESKVFYISSVTNRVGIGTNLINASSQSGYRLFVKDGIKTEKVKVEVAASNGWADYVFNDDYKLMPLEDLDRFIKTNRHLPEVPTTEQAIANGIELKEMNILLLKKIEELTLYTIEQQKRIETLEKTVNLLNK